MTRKQLKELSMREFDIIAIGGGSGGIATMNRAGEHGAKAAVIEEKEIRRNLCQYWLRS